jgi:uncharacterized membrane protein
MPGKSRKTPTTSESVHDQQALERLIFFSDAVFAISITLLALEIRLPAGEETLNNVELAAALLSIWPKYFGFVLSFLVIGFFWISHHRKFRYIWRYDRRLIFLNLLLLMVIAFIPFPTSVLSEHGNRTATIFYALVIILGGLISIAMWWYATDHNRLTDPQLDARQRRKEITMPLITICIFAISIGLSFIDEGLSRFSWILILVLSVAIR